MSNGVIMQPPKRKVERFGDLPPSVRNELTELNIPGVTLEHNEQVLRRLVRSYPDCIPVRLNLASTLLELGQVAEAERNYQIVADSHPAEMGAIAGLATVLAQKQDFVKAEVLAKRALAGDYRWSPCYEVIAQASLARGDREGAANAHLAAYEMSPHGWNSLKAYCELTGRRFESPLDNAAELITLVQLRQLIDFIEHAARSPEEYGRVPGCDHTLRFSKRWAALNGVDFVDLYQYLNANGGFCDCEVCMNVSSLLDDEDWEDDEA